MQFDQFASGSIIIQDIHGNIRYQEVFNKMNQLHVQLDEMAPGMYLVNLNLDQNQKFVKKIIVLNP
ncbi:MAG: T9SS type A sorting domain-containing protein [Saprospiraceae bacterium]|nr:T9SS type A sorting domain-containing protein [Candidatus Vicinibacter affinis]